MSESGDYSPAAWAGHSFDDARRAYDSHVGRSYVDATVKKTTNKDLLQPRIHTDCVNPLIVMCDVTGSMGDWPATMFEKLPYLEHEAKVYLGEDTEICFAAVGDAHSDSYPLQVRPFDKGTKLKKRMLELVIEGGGGGGGSETYELGALYALHNVDIPKAIKPVLIMIGDEMPYPSVSKDMAATVGVKLEKATTTEEIFSSLKRKFEVFLIRKPYQNSGGNSMSAFDIECHRRWADLLGFDHVCDLPDPGRVVDVIFGILAKVVNRFDEFKTEIEGRQKPDQVKTVYESLKTIHTPLGAKALGAKGGGSGKSILLYKEDGSETKSLLGGSGSVDSK